MDNHKRFEQSLVLANKTIKNSGKIGTLGEKQLHLVLKYYFDQNPFNHEIKLGSYYADVYDGEKIIEIQTSNFNLLRNKLNFFLNSNEVRVVYPIVKTKYLIWQNPLNGEIIKKRKSPKIGTVFDIYYELYKIKNILIHPLLKFSIILLNMTEIRNLDGYSKDKKKGSTRFEWIIDGFVDEIRIDNFLDYNKLIPSDLPINFTARDFKEKSKLSIYESRIAVNVLKSITVIKEVGKVKNAFVYTRVI